MKPIGDSSGPTTAADTVGQVRRALAARFRAAGLDSPDTDARLLLATALGTEATALLAGSAAPVAPAARARLDVLAARRLAGEPVARILGEKEFWGLPLRLSAETLVPRPETETLVEAVLAAIPAAERARPLRLLDIGTGSGAILLALLFELRNAVGVATDIAEAALATARANAARLGLVPRFHPVCCDLAAALAGRFDVIVSNPPYVESAAIPTLGCEVRDHDPRRALDGGADGLAFYSPIVGAAARLLAPGGLLAVEVGAGQADAVAETAAMLGPPTVVPDLAGCPRVVVSRAVAQQPGPERRACGK